MKKYEIIGFICLFAAVFCLPFGGIKSLAAFNFLGYLGLSFFLFSYIKKEKLDK